MRFCHGCVWPPSDENSLFNWWHAARQSTPKPKHKGLATATLRWCPGWPGNIATLLLRGSTAINPPQVMGHGRGEGGSETSWQQPGMFTNSLISNKLCKPLRRRVTNSTSSMNWNTKLPLRFLDFFIVQTQTKSEVFGKSPLVQLIRPSVCVDNSLTFILYDTQTQIKICVQLHNPF
jgi:hypothetical protein